MLENTNDIVIVQNNMMAYKTWLQHTKQDYIITQQHNKTQNSIIIIKKNKT